MNLNKKYPVEIDKVKKNNNAKSSFAAPTHTPKTKECLENLGMHCLQTGQCIALKTFGI